MILLGHKMLQYIGGGRRLGRNPRRRRPYCLGRQEAWPMGWANLIQEEAQQTIEANTLTSAPCGKARWCHSSLINRRIEAARRKEKRKKGKREGRALRPAHKYFPRSYATPFQMTRSQVGHMLPLPRFSKKTTLWPLFLNYLLKQVSCNRGRVF
jgi:hypothetical protein